MLGTPFDPVKIFVLIRMNVDSASKSADSRPGLAGKNDVMTYRGRV